MGLITFYAFRSRCRHWSSRICTGSCSHGESCLYSRIIRVNYVTDYNYTGPTRYQVTLYHLSIKQICNETLSVYDYITIQTCARHDLNHCENDHNFTDASRTVGPVCTLACFVPTDSLISSDVSPSLESDSFRSEKCLDPDKDSNIGSRT